VISVLRPDAEVVMVESRGRRVEWLERARIALGLDNAHVLGTRLELVPSRTYRVISARAFAPLPRLLEISARFSTADTQWLLPKGRSARQELALLAGWNHSFHVEQSITDADAGLIVGRLTGRKGGKS
jgi:16S rRNA (guanine527-N7)-methyltransferase